MATKFVPRSVKRKEDITADLSRKCKFVRNRNSHLKTEKLIDERALSASGSLAGKQMIRGGANDSSVTSEPTIDNNFDKGDFYDEEKTVSYSKNQRWPTPGEPVCVICGRYGAYIVDETDEDVCSLECKARHLKSNTRKKDEDLLDNKVDDREAIRTNSSGFLPITVASGNENKSFYKEHPFIAELSTSKVDGIRTNLNIKVKGDDINKPILEFQHCQLSDTLNNNLTHSGYITPTPIQMQVIPLVLSSRDVLACAQTGSGKTAAFLVPIIQKIHLEIDWSLQNKSFNLSDTLGLIMAPTRELCMQIEKQAKELMQGLPNMKTALLVGGLPLPPQRHRLYSGAQIIIGTPGRIQKLLTLPNIHLTSVKIFVLDEVDTMLQMGFEQQVQEVIEKLPEEKQVLMFSATIPSSIESMAGKMLVNPVYVSIGSPSTPNASVKQIVLWVEDKSKKKRLFSILQDSRHFKPPVVVFVISKIGADMLAEAVQKICNLHCLSMHGDKSQSERSMILESFLAGECPVLVCTALLGRGIDLPNVSQICNLHCLSMHGDKSQSERSMILESFLAGECPVLVCTALLGRGIDLPNVSQVINFDMPSSVEEYVHQVGRAGRLGSTGWALTFINNTNKHVFIDLVETLQPLAVTLPEELLNSPYLLQQKQRSKESANKRKHRDKLVTEENLMDLIKKNSTRRKKFS